MDAYLISFNGIFNVLYEHHLFFYPALLAIADEDDE
jgi:hypothetical protein